MEYNELLESAARLTPEWLAGFFDGEGSVCVTSSGVRNPRLKVTITNTDLRVMALIGLRFPGGGPYPARSPRLRKPLYQLGWTGKSAKPILEFIKDYVVIKYDRVLLGIRMAELTMERGCGISEENKTERAELAVEVTRLNDSSRRVSK